MNNNDIIIELYKIGKFPANEDSKSDLFPLERVNELLEKFNIPVTEEEAIKLINLSPPVGTSCYGVEWTLLHLIETVDIKVLQNVINASEENDLKILIQNRLDNYNKMKL